MKTLFWLTSGLLAYAFAGYPLLIWLAAGLVRRRRHARSGGPDVAAAEGQAEPPRVSVLLSVYNEEAVIERKILNFLSIDYPADRLELCVVSDGSTDATEALVRACGSPRVRLFRQEARGGKTRALNRAVHEAQGDILVFTDANAMFRTDCVSRLVGRFADPSIGLVSGVSIYVDAEGGTSAGGVYRRYEEWIKTHESELFSIVGADGAAYAMRRELYTPLSPEYINDLMHPVQAVLAGARAVSEPGAVVEEEADDGDAAAEMRRQTRIMAQSWLVCLRQLPVLARARRWGFIWQVLSHKVLRWLTLPLLALCTLAAGGLSLEGAPYAVALVAIMGGAALAYAGAHGRGGMARVAWLFVVLHMGALNGLLRLLRGETFVVWTPRGD